MCVLSIIIPAYNSGEAIQKCLDSIVPQITDDCEIIIVDDGSSDQSPAICDEYSLSYPFITVIHKKNEGALLTRRCGVRVSHGEYVMFPDADDTLCPHALDLILTEIKRSSSDIICFDWNRIGLDRKKTAIVKQIPTETGITTGTVDLEIFKQLFASGNTTGALSSKVIKKNCFDIEEDYQEWGNRICVSNDLFQMLPCVDRANSVSYIPEALYNYVKTDGSITVAYKEGKVDAYVEVYKRREFYLRKWGISTELIDCATSRSLGAISSLIEAAYRDSKKKKTNAIFFDALSKIRENETIREIYTSLRNRKVKIPRKTNLLLYLCFHRLTLALRVLLKFL